jgi:hypothetical protein
MTDGDWDRFNSYAAHAILTTKREPSGGGEMSNQATWPTTAQCPRCNVTRRVTRPLGPPPEGHHYLCLATCGHVVINPLRA